VKVTTASLEALIRETHNRSMSLMTDAFEQVAASDLEDLLRHIQEEPDMDAKSCFIPPWLNEFQVDDGDLLDALSEKISAAAVEGDFALGALETDIRADIQASLEDALGYQRTYEFGI